MTRAQAAAVVEALEDYFDARIDWEEADAMTSGAGEVNLARIAFESARERLITAMCGEPATDPLAGNAR